MKVRMTLPIVAILLAAASFPASAQATGSQAQSRDSTAGPARQGITSWTSDRRDFRVGDIVTILVDELTIASAEKTNIDEEDRGTSAAAGGVLGAPGSTDRGDLTFRTRLDTESASRGRARRQDVLTTEISARVTSVEAGGVIQLEGSRTLLIDKNEQKVTITGFVRAQDISASNLVESWRLADAQLLYESKGDLGKPKKGILTRILGVLWP